MGLVMGSFFEKQQDIVGWMTALLLLLVGTIFVYMLGVELPAMVESILPWMPSVALAEICHAAFSETVPTTQVLTNLWIVLTISLPLYALIIWKVRRSDR
jgi:biotin transporter BioY